MYRRLLLAALTVYLSVSIARADEATECLVAHNRVRKAHGLAPLQIDKRLCAAAQKHAEYMAKQKKLDHRGPGDEMYFDRARAAGYQTDWSNSSENIAEGPEDFMDAAFTTEAWLESKVGHKDNVLSPKWRDVGFAVARGSDGRLYWCATYARVAASPRERPAKLRFE
jgi:uncharacterized protein YkwD